MYVSKANVQFEVATKTSNHLYVVKEYSHIRLQSDRSNLSEAQRLSCSRRIQLVPSAQAVVVSQ